MGRSDTKDQLLFQIFQIIQLKFKADQSMKPLTLALLSGGMSSEREVSLKSGDQVYAALDKEKYRIVRYDPKTDLMKLMTDAPRIDFSLIILHGPYGEDGTIQGLLDCLNIPYQGSGVLGSAIAMDKVASKILYERAGIPTPPYVVLDGRSEVNPESITTRIGLPLVVKPARGGSSIGMSIVREASEVAGAVEKARAFGSAVLIEAYIEGTELTVAVLGNQDLQPLPVIEIIPDERYVFFDYEAKYTPGASNEICPARIDEDIREQAQHLAMAAHRALFCEGCSRTDMILTDRQIVVLETNTIPGMTQTSLLPRAARTAGIEFGSLLDRLIELGLERHRQG